MIKTVLKEIIIILLLCLAILLVLSVLFYDYNPITKVVPNKIAYTAPEGIKNELAEENELKEVPVESKVYTIEGSDLNIYKKSKSYNPGKANPFASTTMNTNVVDNSSSVGNTTETESTSTNIVENTTNTASANNTTFWNTTGRK